MEVRSYEGGLHEVAVYLPDGLTELELRAVEAVTCHNVVNVLGKGRALIWQSVLRIDEANPDDDCGGG